MQVSIGVSIFALTILGACCALAQPGRVARRITIDAAGYDEIVWISRRSLSETAAPAGTPWPSGEVVQRGAVFDYSDRGTTLSYVRAEVIRHTETGPVRLLLNPFAFSRR